MGGIAVIRVSGDRAVEIVAKRWQGADLDKMQSHTAHLGHITDTGGEVLDEVVLTLFRAPNSFTGEDIIEISCHGSVWIQQQIVNTLIDAGCRAATGGEFTRRAFANGKMDLSQAEAVADVIASSSRASHRVAMNQMRGGFSRELENLRDQLLQFVSLIELELDFSEEDVTFADREKLITLAVKIQSIINSLADSYSAGNVIKNGLPVAIVGQTNAGKSTLLNYLLKDDRALVSDIQGTTRDVIEDTIVMGGTLFRFIDTAGIRRAHDEIESMGIERTFKKLDEARLVLWVIDATAPIEEVKKFSDSIIARCADKKLIAVVNKCDLADDKAQSLMRDTLCKLLSTSVSDLTSKGQYPDSGSIDDKSCDKNSEAVNSHIIFISAKKNIRLDQLTSMLIDAVALPAVDDNAVIVTNARHYEALVRAGEAITRAIQGLHQGLSGDLLSQDIRECMHYLGEITGEITTDELLGNIFSHFCIGK
jgi:tRNA modification GTPase